MIRIHVWWRGATPDEINVNLADPIERQIATVDGLDTMESSSIEGMYTLVANFKYSVNVDVAYQDALAAMARVARQLPKDIDPPIVIKADRGSRSSNRRCPKAFGWAWWKTRRNTSSPP